MGGGPIAPSLTEWAPPPAGPPAAGGAARRGLLASISGHGRQPEPRVGLSRESELAARVASAAGGSFLGPMMRQAMTERPITQDPYLKMEIWPPWPLRALMLQISSLRKAEDRCFDHII